jgi:phage gpG-like protein
MITVDTSELQAAVRQLEAKGKNVGRLMPVIAEMLVSAVSDVYEAEGPGWQDLAEETKQARRGSSYKILRDTGVMAGSTTPGHGADWAEAYAGAAYADFHSRGNAHLPRRDPFDLGPFMDDVLDDVENLVLLEVTS